MLSALLPHLGAKDLLFSVLARVYVGQRTPTERWADKAGFLSGAFAFHGRCLETLYILQAKGRLSGN